LAFAFRWAAKVAIVMLNLKFKPIDREFAQIHPLYDEKIFTDMHQLLFPALGIEA
jgi:deoxyadenosine/deoxycytidine kinase